MLKSANETPLTESNFVRSRINTLLRKATTRPLTIVFAGAGCGKSRAVNDFVSSSSIPTAWVRITRFDNVGSRFWESYISAIERATNSTETELRKLGFPDSDEKLSRYLRIRERFMESTRDQRFLTVFDDFHLIDEPSLVHCLEKVLNHVPSNRPLIVISRKLPSLNLMGLQRDGNVSLLDEQDLNFTEDELEAYLEQQGLSVDKCELREIHQDTRGWALPLYFIALSLKKTRGYRGYTRSALKQNLFGMMDAEVWEKISERAKGFLIRLSLIDLLSADLVALLSGGDPDLMDELGRQNHYIRYDHFTGTYLIHHFFVVYLRSKQGQLSERERRETYRTAALWCGQNGYTVDALNYLEKIGDYKSIVSVALDKSLWMPKDLALFMVGIFERAEASVFEQVEHFAALHLYVLLVLCRWWEFFQMATHYEGLFPACPPEDVFRNRLLGEIHCVRALARLLTGMEDGRDGFFAYFADLKKPRIDPLLLPENLSGIPLGLWLCTSGSSEKGEPQNYNKIVIDSLRSISGYLGGFLQGGKELIQGEFLFYQGNVQKAEPLIARALSLARGNRAFPLVFRALFYTMRIAVMRGDRKAAERALEDIGAARDEKEYPHRFTDYDLALCWYNCALRHLDAVPVWLREAFAPQGEKLNPESLSDAIKVRYYYLARQYVPLLAYLEDAKRHHIPLLGLVEALVLEACVRYRMKDRQGALATLQIAYNTASPNDIVMPFIEMGKDMRTLTISALRAQSSEIPQLWLENIRRKSALYAKHQALIITESAVDVGEWRMLSHREIEVLRDQYLGLTRSEIATKRELSLGTVNMIVESIMTKLNARTVIDVIRIAVERKIL